MFSTFNSVHSSIAKNVKNIVNKVVNISSVTYNGTTVSSFSNSLGTGNKIINAKNTSQTYDVYAFGDVSGTGIYSINYSCSAQTTAYVLAVGGGGGGGSYMGGGGGGGGVVMLPVTLNPSVGTMNISIGKGGIGADANSVNIRCTSGDNTTVTFSASSGTIASPSVITAYGGGNGGTGGGGAGVAAYLAPSTGGSGGGAGYVSGSGATGNINNNNNAKNGGSNVGNGAGGGGGAGTSGTNGIVGNGTNGLNGYGGVSDGGNGITCSLPGIIDFKPSTTSYGTYYWAGGGGGPNNGKGGLGGGSGCGNTNGTTGGSGGINLGTGTGGINNNSGAAGANTGGGGGASWNRVSGPGGSGIVVIAFPIVDPFTPKSISGLNLWFDASDISGNGTTVTNGTLINKWFDKSGSNNHAIANTNITYNSTGLNSKSTMTFDSSTKYLTGNNSISGPYLAMFVIASIRNSPPAVSVAIAFSSGLEVVPYDNTAFTEFTLNSTTGHIPFRNVNAPPYQPNPLPYLPPTSTPTLFEAWFDGSFMYSTAQSGSNTTNYLTTKTASSGNFSSTFFCLGNSTAPSYGNAYFTGSISEILVYNPSSALAYSDIQKIEGYLSWKWGLQTNLQTSHPYYNNPP
jgi:hypothetical protein